MTGSVTDTLTALGISVVGASGGEVLAHCPAHEERTGRPDRNPSWWINTGTGKHICFSCGFKGGLEYLVAYVKGYDTAEASAFVRDHRPEIDVNLIRTQINDAVARNYAVPNPRAGLPESSLALFGQPPEWAMNERRVTAEACEQFEIRWNDPENLWIIPLRHPDGTLMGWQEKNQGGARHFRNRPPAMRKSATFFGWKQSTDLDDLVVVESPLDAVRLASVGIPGGLAVCGSMMSAAQYNLLAQSNVIAAFDNPKVDPAGAKAAKDMLRMSLRNGFRCKFFAYGDTDKKDIGELSAGAIRRGLANAMSNVYGNKAIYA